MMHKRKRADKKKKSSSSSTQEEIDRAVWGAYLEAPVIQLPSKVSIGLDLIIDNECDPRYVCIVGDYVSAQIGELSLESDPAVHVFCTRSQKSFDQESTPEFVRRLVKKYDSAKLDDGWCVACEVASFSKSTLCVDLWKESDAIEYCFQFLTAVDHETRAGFARRASEKISKRIGRNVAVLDKNGFWKLMRFVGGNKRKAQMESLMDDSYDSDDSEDSIFGSGRSHRYQPKNTPRQTRWPISPPTLKELAMGEVFSSR